MDIGQKVRHLGLGDVGVVRGRERHGRELSVVVYWPDEENPEYRQTEEDPRVLEVVS